MKFARKLMPLMLAGSMLVGALSPIAGTVDAAEARAELSVRKTTVAPIIDGSLDESIWSINEELSVPLSAEGSDALQSRMGLMWDNDYLYIGVQNSDPLLAASPNVAQDPTGQAGDYWWDHPNVSIYLDPTLHQSAPFQGKDVQLGFVYKPDTTTPYFSFGAAQTHTGRDEKSILRAISTTAEGWNLEVAIPWSFLEVDPLQVRQLGLEVAAGAHHMKEDSTLLSPLKAWSAYNSQSFWNDTSGYGVIRLDDANPLSGNVSDVLLEEDFSSYADGATPYGWISNVNGSSPPFQVQGGRLVADAGAAGQQSRIFAPVQWDDYVVEADMQFQQVLNSGRWASLIFRAPSAGVHPYNQMAVRQSGAYEFALRDASNQWQVPHKGTSEALELNKDYTFKVRVVGNNVKEYIKAAEADTYQLLIDQSMDSLLLERGKVGFQVDQARLSVANLKVTRVVPTNLEFTLPTEVEALTGALQAPVQVAYSDGIVEAVDSKRLKWRSSDETVVRVVNNELLPLAEGTAQVTAVYRNIEVTRELTVKPSRTGKKVVKLSHDTGYMLANTNEAIDLSQWQFAADFSDYSSGMVAGNTLVWHAEAADAVITDGMLTLKRPGLLKLQAQADEAVIDFYMVAKAASDTEYVLYEEDFDGVAEGALPEGWRVLEQAGSSAIGVKDGQLELNASGQTARVLLPKELDQFGDYRIDAVVTHAKVNEPTRWHSIMYRVQNSNYPYYQMAVRQNATAANGVEFAERTPANGWSVMASRAYSERIQADKLYTYTIKAHGNRVQQWINDELLIHTSGARSYQQGAIGLQANGSVMRVDSIKVSLQLEELPPTLEENIVNVVEPDTSISLAPTVVATMEGQAKLELQEGKLPATVMLHLNDKLQVTGTKDGEPVQSVEDALKVLGSKVMPAFYVHDAQTVTALIAYLKRQEIGDTFVVSDQPELVKQARTAYPLIRGIIDFPDASAELTSEQLMDIRRTTNASMAKIALLPERAASREQVEYLQGRLITVWAKVDGGSSMPEAVTHHKLITAGVNGIVTASPGTLIDALATYNQHTTLIRKPWIIGHRGIPALAPENTLESAKLAYDKGADIVENDIYLTKDNQIVIMHDSTLDRTTNATGAVEGNYTLAELQAILANKQFPSEYPNARIPSLEQFFKEFKQTDLIHFIEIKTNNPNIIDPLVALIQQYDVEDQVVIITFDANQLKRMNEKMPGMSNGYLLGGGLAADSDIPGSIYRVLSTIQPLGATYNTGYGTFGSKFLEASKHRGITTWPWTYRNRNDFTNAFVMGTYGLTTDYAHWASNWPNQVSSEQPSYTLQVGEQAELNVKVRTYTGEEAGQSGEVVILSGQEFIEAAGGKVRAKANGTAYVSVRYTSTKEGAPVYDLYTQPIAVQVKAPVALPTSVTIDQQNVNLTVGSSVQLTATVMPEAADKSITWTIQASSTPNVIELTEAGAVKAMKPGTATVRATSIARDVYAERVITVKQGQVYYPGQPTTPTTPSTPGTESGQQPGQEQEPTPGTESGKAIAVEATVDGATSLARAEVKADQLASALQAAGGGGVKTVRIKVAVQSGAGVQQIEVAVPSNALNQPTLQHQLEIITEYGTVILPSNYVDSSVSTTGDKVKLTISRADAARISEPLRAKIGSRPVIQVQLTGNNQAVIPGRAGAAVEIELPYQLADREQDHAHTLVVWAIDENGHATAVPGARYDATAAAVRGGLNEMGTYAIAQMGAAPFNDLDKYGWAKQQIEALAAREVILGTRTDTYSPAALMTRADYVTLLVRMLGLEGSSVTPFTDVRATDYYYEPLNIAKSLGLIEGQGEGRYHPKGTITRQEMFTIAARALDKLELKQLDSDASLKGYSDADQVAAYAKESVAGLIASGLVQGSNGKLHPTASATRAETAVFLYRLLNHIYE
ncbi:glycerophosphodiester phosphodiesterase family protein [Paenibacillus sp. SYP-B4298]|uniref:glycerophosphodiester phosphodiesterase family protein n=1 Tax=Paenibacillus sp. SYP-B4298 TaxID=2996034 RepID=UPI0022DE754F|nr:glycerophosphodiester phosphodiesterase family protein [Paenibacillus sp. SYP-B4298]